MITIAVAFVAVEFTNIWLTDEYVLLTFENVVVIQKKGTKKGLIRRKERPCFVECYEVHFFACNL